LLSRSEGARTMVFVNTKAWVERVARALEKAHYRVGVLSGDVPQKKRQSLLTKFQRGDLEIIVVTDVAARGLHIDGVSHVYNYDLPFDAEDYVHRIGRTARLGAEGDAISFACEMYAQGLPDIEAYIEQKIPTEPVTAELLVAIPRTPRAHVPSVEGEENDSISSIYKEVREAAANSKTGSKPGARKPGGPNKSGPSRSSSARPGDKPRSPSSNDGKPRTHAPNDGKPRPPRTPRPPREASQNIAASVVTAEIPVVVGTPDNAGVSKESFLQRLAKRVKFWGKA